MARGEDAGTPDLSRKTTGHAGRKGNEEEAHTPRRGKDSLIIFMGSLPPGGTRADSETVPPAPSVAWSTGATIRPMRPFAHSFARMRLMMSHSS